MKNKVKRAWQFIAGEAAMIWLWVKNLFFVFLTTKSQVRIFEGYGHYWFAQKYADKRTKISRANKYCGGKFHYVLPTGDYSLGVFSSLDLNYGRKKGWINKNFKINKVLETAYYVAR